MMRTILTVLYLLIKRQPKIKAKRLVKAQLGRSPAFGQAFAQLLIGFDPKKQKLLNIIPYSVHSYFNKLN